MLKRDAIFTGRRVDYLNSGSLKLQYNRNRYYDQYTGRWLTHDPLGITPASEPYNSFDVSKQFIDGPNLYEYVDCNPLAFLDALGLKAECKKGDKQIKINKMPQ